MMVLIDNYDSFTYNIFQILAGNGHDVRVVRNDAVTLQALIDMRPERLIVSPGPGRPAEAGISMASIRHFAGRVPVLGICLGHQCLAEAFGGKVIQAGLMHGKTSAIFHDAQKLFVDLPQPFTATRYHSLLVERESLPSALTVSAWTKAGEIMGLRHDSTGAEGVQFHPESILSEAGDALLEAFARC